MIFDSKSLNAAVTEQLAAANIDPTHTNAFALVATTGGGVRAVLSTKIGNIWQVDTVLRVAHGTKIEGGVQIRATW